MMTPLRWISKSGMHRNGSWRCVCLFSKNDSAWANWASAGWVNHHLNVLCTWMALTNSGHHSQIQSYIPGLRSHLKYSSLTILHIVTAVCAAQSTINVIANHQLVAKAWHCNALLLAHVTLSIDQPVLRGWLKIKKVHISKAKGMMNSAKRDTLAMVVVKKWRNVIGTSK